MKVIYLFLLLVPCACAQLLALNSTMKQYVKKLGREMFGVGDTDKASTGSNFRPKPSDTWAQWLRNDRNNMKQRKKNKSKRKNRQRILKNAGVSKVGAPGPQGPAGGPGVEVSIPAIMSQLRSILRTKNIQATTRSGRFNLNSGNIVVAGIPDIISGFAMTTKSTVPVAMRSSLELNGFEVAKDGCFQRGDSVNRNNGRFRAPVTAVYSFHASVHLSIPRGAKDFIRKDFVTVNICIDGNCQKHATLSATAGLGTNSRIFTVNVNGYLYLMANQYVSVHVYNNSPKHIVTALKSSYFTGMLIGT